MHLKRGFRVLGFTLHFALGLCPDCEMKLYLISGFLTIDSRDFVIGVVLTHRLLECKELMLWWSSRDSTWTQRAMNLLLPTELVILWTLFDYIFYRGLMNWVLYFSTHAFFVHH
jgi:hypothetical protein